MDMDGWVGVLSAEMSCHRVWQRVHSPPARIWKQDHMCDMLTWRLADVAVDVDENVANSLNRALPAAAMHCVSDMSCQGNDFMM